MSNPMQPLPNQAPYSQEAEEALLGAVLLDPKSFLNIASFLSADDFFLKRHEYVWMALSRLQERNDPMDYVTVSQELHDIGVLEEIGGQAYLTYLVNNTPSSVHVEVYGRLVERASIRRKMLEATDEIRKLALDEEIPLDKVISDAEQALFSVSDSQVKREFVPMWQAVSEYYDDMEKLLASGAGLVGIPTGFKALDGLLGGFQKSDLVVFAGRPGMGKCVTGDTLIATTQGMRPIADLKPDTVGIIDDEGGTFYPLEVGVQTPNGAKTTSHFYDSGIKPTLKFTTRAGYSLAGTYHHPVLILSPSGKKVWKHLDELQVGDYVAVQRHEAVWGNCDRISEFSYDYNENLRSTKVPKFPEKIDKKLAYILGILIGDGGLTRKRNISISSADSMIIDIFYKWVNSLGLRAQLNSGYDHRVTSMVLKAWLENIGVTGYSHEKKIPEIILNSSKRCVKAFLQGLFDTDGHAESQRGYIQYVTASRKLAKQVQLLLLQFGIVSKLSFKPNKKRGAWSIRITGDNARCFYSEIGFKLERKQTRSNRLPHISNANLDVIPHLPDVEVPYGYRDRYARYFDDRRKPSYTTLETIAEFQPAVSQLLEPKFYWDEIQNIEDNGLQHCYDLTVPDGHTFVANGIVSHNTSFLLTVALNIARLDGRVALFTMEMGVEQMVQRLISMETGIRVQQLRTADLSANEQSRFTEAVGRIANLPIFIDDTPAINPIEMRTKCRRLQHEYGLDLVMVDYMQLMSAGKAYENNRVQEISYISRSLKELARELNVTILSAAQLSRAVEQRQDKRPQLSDLRESGCLAGETQIYLPDKGYSVPIETLVGKTGFKVLSLNTETWKLESGTVTNAFCTGTKPVYRLKTALGRTLRATANHRFLTVKGWKRLDELELNSYISLPRNLPPTPSNFMEDSELALMAHLIGDGCTLPRHAIQYTTVESDLAELVANFAYHLFGEKIAPRIQKEKNRTWYQVFLPAIEHLTHNVRNPISVWLEEYNIFGLRSHEKFIPISVFKQSNEKIALFLRHLWATDGCINFKRSTQKSYPIVYYATSSYQLAIDVANLLLRLGINARLKCVPQGHKGRDQFHVIVSGHEDLTLFAKEIEAVGIRKNIELEKIVTYLKTSVANTNRDIIPKSIWRDHAVPSMQAHGITNREMQAQLGNAYCGTTLYKHNVSRDRAFRLSQIVKSKEIQKLAESDVYWDKIMSIEPDGETAVYDLTVEKYHNFCADMMIVHNSIEQDADAVMFLYRDEVYNPETTEFPNQADVILSKHRHGPTGTISLYFEKTITKFMDVNMQRVDLSDLE